MISAALIVKNEERVLARCLDSLRDAVDEIVIVDTGSEDATKEIARRYTDRVFDFAWCHDFAAARQFAFDQARGDWVMWVDADDVVLHAERIRTLLESAPLEAGGFYWRYVYDQDAWGNARCECWRERCVRNDGAFRWEGRIHEVLVPKQPRTMVQSAEVVVVHHPESNRAFEKQRRNLSILEAEYTASGDAPSSRLLFYLASEYAGAGKTQRAIDAFLQYLQIAPWDDERYLAQGRVANLYRVQRRYDQAINADLQALKICPHWPDAYFGLAETYYHLRDWHKVIHWTELARAMPLPQTIHIINPLDYRFNWIIYYTNALYHIGEVREAMKWTQRALEICPDDPWHRENFLFFAQTLQTAENSATSSPPSPVSIDPDCHKRIANQSLSHQAAAWAGECNELARGVSVIIPYGGTERLPLLTATLENLRKCAGVGEVIVVELGASPCAIEVARRYADKYVFAQHAGEFSRARALNIGTPLARYDLLLWLDSDIIGPLGFVERVAAELRARQLDCLVPYNSVRYLTADDSQAVRRGSRNPADCTPANVFNAREGMSGAAMLVRKEFVVKFGGLCEEFYGWGGEDDAWLWKARVLGKTEITDASDLSLIHLFHPDSGGNNWGASAEANPHYQTNLAVLNEVYAIKDPEQFLRRFPAPKTYSCPWRADQRLIFLAADGDAEQAAQAAAMAQTLTGWYGCEIACVSVNEVQEAFDWTLLRQADAVAVFGAALMDCLLSRAEFTGLRAKVLAVGEVEGDRQAQTVALIQSLSFILGGAPRSDSASFDEAGEMRYAQEGAAIHFSGALPVKQKNARGERHIGELPGWPARKEIWPSVGFYCPQEWQPWSPRILKTAGAGGSETAAMHMAKSLADLGHQVTVYNQNDGEQWHEGVSYLDYRTFNPTATPQVLIAWRAPEMADFGEIGDQRYLWMHDMDVGDRLTPERAEKFSAIFVLSEAHKAHMLDRYFFLDESRLRVTRNGLDLARFNQVAARNPHRLIYSSSPDRGLDVLLTIFPRIKEQCPDATLDIFYGWAGFDLEIQLHPYLAIFKENVMQLLNQPGVTHRGQVDQMQLAREMLSSGLWVYPTARPETSCITAMEAQAGGAVPVTRPLAALTETVKFGHLIDGDVYDPVTQARYVETVVSLLQHPEEQERIRAQMMPWARQALSWEGVARQWQRWFALDGYRSRDFCRHPISDGGDYGRLHYSLN